MIQLRPSINSEVEYLRTIFGETIKNKTAVNFPDGFVLTPEYLMNQNNSSSPFFWTVWVDGNQAGSAFHCFMPRCNSAYFALGLSESFQGNNIGSKITKELVNIIFETTPAHRIEAGTAVQNTASNRVLEKCGFSKEGVQRKGIIVEGKPIDYVLWGTEGYGVHCSN